MEQATCDSTKAKKRILFFTSALGGGGAEMHLLRVINHMDRKLFEPSLALVRSGGDFERFLAKDIDLRILKTGNSSASLVRLLRAVVPLSKVIDELRPDILCPVMDYPNITAFLASRLSKHRPKVVPSVQAPPTYVYRKYTKLFRKLSLVLIRETYKREVCIIALSRGVATDILTLAPQLKDRIEVIHNAGVDEMVLKGAAEIDLEIQKPQDAPLVIACGRLSEQKGFSYLINALSYVRAAIPTHLWIIGEGALRPSLEEQIKRLGLQDSIRLLGFKTNPYKFMATGDLFVLSSLHEGFGNVVVEAMACGLPVIATACPYGPDEIIQNDVNGILVPPADAEALAAAIIKVLSDSTVKNLLLLNGKRRSEDFSAQRIAMAYGDCFLNVADA